MAFVLALVGSLCWGIAPVFGKLGLTRVEPSTGLAIRTLMAAVVVSGWLVGTGRAQELKEVPWQAWALIAAEGLLATLFGDLAYYAALKWGAAIDVTLVLASAPLITLWAAAAFLAEEVTWPRLAGAAFIVCGLLLVGAGPRA